MHFGLNLQAWPLGPISLHRKHSFVNKSMHLPRLVGERPGNGRDTPRRFPRPLRKANTNRRCLVRDTG
jgi:hypothetical protein